MAYLPFLSYFFFFYSFLSLLLHFFLELRALCFIIIRRRLSLPSQGEILSSRTSRNKSPHFINKVYLTLCCALVASAAGACLHLLWNLGGIITALACIGSLASHEEKTSVATLMGAALFEGASIGPLIEATINIDPSLLITAFVGTAVAFGCFSGAAMFAKYTDYLYLGGLLSSGLSILMWLHYASAIFGGSTAIFKFELYFGLLIFVGFMVVDTQEIIERAQLGELDNLKHTLNLFTDFIGILIIVLKNTAEKNEKKKKKKKKERLS